MSDTDSTQFDLRRWVRIEVEGLPLWIDGERPDWLVPNAAGDALLRRLARGERPPLDAADRRFLARLPAAAADAARSAAARADPQGTDAAAALAAPQGTDAAAATSTAPAPPLRELWLHLTDRCNLACRHCLFSCGPGASRELSTERLLTLADEALGPTLAVPVFALTGGEPMLHDGFVPLVDRLLRAPQSHVVVLTNATLLSQHREALARWPGDRFHLQVSVDGLQPRHDHLRGGGAFETLRRELDTLRALGQPFTLSMCPSATNLQDVAPLVDLAAEWGATNVHYLWYFVRGRGDETEVVAPAALYDAVVEAASRAERHGVGIDNLDALRSQVFAPVGTRHVGGTPGVEAAAVGPDGALYPSAALIGVDSLATPLPSAPDDATQAAPGGATRAAPRGLGGLARAWRDGAAFSVFREAHAGRLASPWRLLLGGGDPDHSYLHAGTPLGDDPYLPLYERLAGWLIARQAERGPEATIAGPPRLRLKMGDVLESCGAEGAEARVHANCLLSVAAPDARAAVSSFYTEAAHAAKEDILNPVGYAEELIAHVPPRFRFRGYGCGSPINDAELQTGDRVVDLGSGRGVECFIAAKLVGAQGTVTGVDMLDPMLEAAEAGAAAVAGELGYRNLTFRKGLLEALPLPDTSADVVVSNCVLNLSPDKRATFAEIRRVLRPGGRLVVSDVVCETEPDAAIRNDDTLKGECIGGALTQRDLFGLLDETGFVACRAVKRFPYRLVRGHPFFSLTFEAHRPVGPTSAVSPASARTADDVSAEALGCSATIGSDSKPGTGSKHADGEGNKDGDALRRVMYRGPFQAVVTHRGRWLWAGHPQTVSADEVIGHGDQLLELDDDGAVTNFAFEGSCCCSAPDGLVSLEIGDCCAPPEASNASPGAGSSGCCAPPAKTAPPPETSGCCAPPGKTTAGLVEGIAKVAPRHDAGCLVCGAPLVYETVEREAPCHYCGRELAANARCEAGHFVCDACHLGDGVAVVQHLCATSAETDLVRLFDRIRRHPAIPIHGPEHHAAVPGVILATYRNLGGAVTDEMLATGIRRGAGVAGGYCAFMGICAAAIGVGIAFAILLESDPCDADVRQQVQRITHEVLGEISRYRAGRCCQRDGWIALRKAAEISERLLPIGLQADAPLPCRQVKQNQECIREACPLYPRNVKAAARRRSEEPEPEPAP